MTTGGRFAVGCDPDACTVIEKAGSETVEWPSLTLITMLRYVVPTCETPGAPVRRPVWVLNAVHGGWFVTENVRRRRSGSLAAGRKCQVVRAMAVVGAKPEITGGRLPVPASVGGRSLLPPAAGWRIWIEKAGSEAVCLPSLTLMTIFRCVPTCEIPGAPVSRPVCVLNAAQSGLLRTEKVNRRPSGSRADG